MGEAVAHPDDLLPRDLRIPLAHLGKHVARGFADNVKRVGNRVLRVPLERTGVMPWTNSCAALA